MPLISAKDSCSSVSYYDFFSKWRSQQSSRTAEEIEKIRQQSFRFSFLFAYFQCLRINRIIKEQRENMKDGKKQPLRMHKNRQRFLLNL